MLTLRLIASRAVQFALLHAAIYFNEDGESLLARKLPVWSTCKVGVAVVKWLQTTRIELRRTGNIVEHRLFMFALAKSSFECLELFVCLPMGRGCD